MLNCKLAGQRINATGVHNYLESLTSHVFGIGLDHLGHKVKRVTLLGVALTGPREDGHRDLGQVVKNQVIESTVSNQLSRPLWSVSPEARSTPNPNRRFYLAHFSDIGTIICICELFRTAL